MYWLADDPDEMINRFDDPAYAAVRRELACAIADRLKDQREKAPASGIA